MIVTSPRRVATKLTRLAFLSVVCVYTLLVITPVSAAEAVKSSKPQKVKITATVVSRDGNTVNVADKKDGSTKIVNVNDQTQIQRGGKTMSMNALVPHLKVKIEGIKTEEGQIEAKRVHLKPNAFDITVAQQQEIVDNKAAAAHAQTTADQGVANAAAAQATADEGVAAAKAANAAAAADAAAVQTVNKRVSDLGEYATVATVGVYFANNSYKLNDKGKAALDQLISANSNVNGYRVEIAGYTSNTGTVGYNQRLSERRAAAVAQYLRENAGVLMWRILVPAGYGETRSAASNNDSDDRALNRRVEVRILVGKGLQQDSQVATAQP